MEGQYTLTAKVGMTNGTKIARMLLGRATDGRTDPILGEKKKCHNKLTALTNVPGRTVKCQVWTPTIAELAGRLFVDNSSSGSYLVVVDR